MRALSCLLCIIEIIKINSRSSSIMMLTSCGAGRLMERSMKFTDIIFMKHEEDLSLPVSFFMHVRQICAKKTKRGASCKFGSTIVSRFRKIQQPRSTQAWCLPLWCDCSVNQIGFLNKLRDYRDYRYERAGWTAIAHPKANVCTLMRTCGKLQCVRITGVNCYDELLEIWILSKKVFPPQQ